MFECAVIVRVCLRDVECEQIFGRVFDDVLCAFALLELGDDDC